MNDKECYLWQTVIPHKLKKKVVYVTCMYFKNTYIWFLFPKHLLPKSNYVCSAICLTGVYIYIYIYSRLTTGLSYAKQSQYILKPNLISVPFSSLSLYIFIHFHSNCYNAFHGAFFFLSLPENMHIANLYSMNRHHLVKKLRQRLT